MEPKQPAVTCKSCSRVWNSDSMAEGLRLLGACPRCGGELEFHAAPDREARTTRPTEADVADSLAPHLVLGIPRR
jgi:hypothetical protein